MLLKGRLTVLDMGLLKQIWKIPEAKENALNAALEAKTDGDDPAAIERTISMFFQMVEHLPHAVQCILTTANNPNCWGLLREEFITGSSSELALKYGLAIDGEWSLLGIIDAKPANQSDNDASAQAIMSAVSGNGIAMEIGRMAEIVRQMGRPTTAFGLTPLLIFRQAAN